MTPFTPIPVLCYCYAEQVNIVNIGNPPQKVFAQLDTGSFELWVNPDCRSVGGADQRFCQAAGNYDPQRSSSAFVSDKTATLRYGIGSADIRYVLDDMALPGSGTMRQVQFGVATTSRQQFSGILGIGAGDGVNTKYKNFVDQLAAQGITNTKAYSVALGSSVDRQGSVVFGGVDTSKFSGKLRGLPTVPADRSPDKVARFWVTMQSVKHTAPDGRQTTLPGGAMPVFLDTGATLTLLPTPLADALARAVGARPRNQQGLYPVDCRLMRRSGTVDFGFDGVTVRVPYREIIRMIRTPAPVCQLGVMPSDEFALLGDTFLRSAYGTFDTPTECGLALIFLAVVFDIAGATTYLAQHANCGSSPQPIRQSADIAAMTGRCSAGAINDSIKPVDSEDQDDGKDEEKGAGVQVTARTWTWAWALAWAVVLSVLLLHVLC